jgi:hypothetical protein
MALPFPAYGAGVPERLQGVPANSRIAAARVPGPAPTSLPSAKSAATRRANASALQPPDAAKLNRSSRASWVSSLYWPKGNSGFQRSLHQTIGALILRAIFHTGVSII